MSDYWGWIHSFDAPSVRLVRGIRWIRGRHDETLRVEELAALATMSVSSFHRHFRAVTSMARTGHGGLTQHDQSAVWPDAYWPPTPNRIDYRP